MTWVFTVTASDVSTGRVSNKAVEMTCLPLGSPIVGISTSDLANVNFLKRVTIAATVQLPAASDRPAQSAGAAPHSANAVWTVYPPIESTFAAVPLLLRMEAATHTATNTYDLVLLDNALASAQTYTFTLTAAMDYGRSSTTSLTVVTNSTPDPGVFSVTPAVGGRELTTFFAYSAALWEDADFPLSYAFGHIGRGSYMVLRARCARATRSRLLGFSCREARRRAQFRPMLTTRAPRKCTRMCVWRS